MLSFFSRLFLSVFFLAFVLEVKDSGFPERTMREAEASPTKSSVFGDSLESLALNLWLWTFVGSPLKR